MVQILTTWKDYATVKTWKKGLKSDSHNNRLSEDTEKAIHLYMPLFLEYKQKNPDDIIEEALAGKSVVKETLSDFCTWLEDEKNKSFNHAVHITHHVIRGFYSHNNINTQKISIPTLDPSSVQTTDDNFPVFDIVEVEDVDGKKDKVMKIKRELLCKFLDLLSFRNKVFIMCIKDTGADNGDIGKWTLDDIRYQDDFDRIFIRKKRNKSGQIACYLLSKETTNLVRRYEKLHRKTADGLEFLFVQSMKEFKRAFFTKHRRQFDKETDRLELSSFDIDNVADECRTACIELEKILAAEGNPMKILRKGQQSPLRPKRWRKIFSDVCDYAGIPVDIKRLFMGKKDPANQTYEGKSRQNLEMYYDRIEPLLTLYSDPKPIPKEELQKLRRQIELEKLEKEHIKKETDKKLDEIMDRLRAVEEKKVKENIPSWNEKL